MTISTSVPLGDLLDRVERKTLVQTSATYSMLGVRSFGGGCFDAGAKVGEDTRYPYFLQAKAGDLVYPKLMAWEGAFAIVQDELDGRFVSPEFCTFTITSSRVNIDYIRHYFRWPTAWSHIAGSSPGTNVRRRRLHPNDFIARRIPLPGLEEQHQIAARLNALWERREMCAKTVRRAEEMIHALHDSLCRVPGSTCRIGDIISLQRRPVSVEPSREYVEIGVRSFGKGVFHKEPRSGHEFGAKRVFEIHPGDLIISNVFAWEGGIAVAGEQEQGKLGSHRFLTYKEASDAVDINFIRYFLLSGHGISLVQGVSPGSAGRNRTLGLNAFENLEITIPDIGKQQQIASQLNRVYAALRQIYERERQLDALLAAALNAAFADL